LALTFSWTGGGVQASRGLYDQEKDTFASSSYRNKSLFAVATVYGLYFE
jgi:hypothetical protein